MTVLYFGIARDHSGASSEVMELTGDVMVGELWGMLILRHPGLSGIRDFCRIAVDQVYASDETPVRDDGEVAVIPPVAGG